MFDKMKLVHWSSHKKAVLDKGGSCSSKYDQDIWIKPNGLWLSNENNENNWSKFIKCEEYDLDEYEYGAEFKIKENAKIYIITNDYSYHKFHEKYKGKEKSMANCIDWVEVAKDYDGIYIEPHKIKQFTGNWIKYWDVDSACIWNLDIIEKVALSYQYHLNEMEKYDVW